MILAATNKDNTAAEKSAECVFTKEQLKASQKFANRKDLLEVLLEDNKKYPVAKVEQMIEKFMKGKVN